MTEFKDLTPSGQEAAKACAKHNSNQAQTKQEEGLLNNSLVNAYARWKGVTNEKDAYSNATKGIDGVKATFKHEQDCIDEVRKNELAGKKPLWEPAKKTSEAPSDKGKVADAKPQSGELSDFAKSFSKFASGLANMFGSKDGNPESLISRDSMPGRMLANRYSPDPVSHVQVQQGLPPVPKTASKGAAVGN
jgi:hypothetical protein